MKAHGDMPRARFARGAAAAILAAAEERGLRAALTTVLSSAGRDPGRVAGLGKASASATASCSQAEQEQRDGFVQ